MRSVACTQKKKDVSCLFIDEYPICCLNKIELVIKWSLMVNK
jgi:hypothetical protein